MEGRCRRREYGMGTRGNLLALIWIRGVWGLFRFFYSGILAEAREGLFQRGQKAVHGRSYADTRPLFVRRSGRVDGHELAGVVQDGGSRDRNEVQVVQFQLVMDPATAFIRHLPAEDLPPGFGVERGDDPNRLPGLGEIDGLGHLDGTSALGFSEEKSGHVAGDRVSSQGRGRQGKRANLGIEMGLSGEGVPQPQTGEGFIGIGGV